MGHARRAARPRPPWRHSTARLPARTAYYAWAWEDAEAGTIRSRYFASGYGIVEDEATGLAAVVITDRLGRDLEIRQGRGSRLSTRLGPDGTVELGGRVVLDEVRRYG